MPGLFTSEDMSSLSALAESLENVITLLESGAIMKTLETWGEEELEEWYREWPRPEWAELSAFTLAWKRAMGYPPTALVRTGRLRDAATTRGAEGNVFQTSDEGETYDLTMGVEGADYFVWQNEGTDRIPARPWDVVTDEDLERLAEDVISDVQEWFDEV